MLTIEEAIAKFEEELPEEIQLSCETDEVLNPLHELEQRYGVALSPAMVMVIVGEVPLPELPAFLIRQYGLNEAQASEVGKSLEEKVLKPLIDRLNFLNAHPEKAVTLEQEKDYAERIFRENLLAELRHDPLIISSVNNRLFYILARDESFGGRLERALYENMESFTRRKIMLNGETVSPTVANWLKDYIQKFGSQTYDSVSQTSFLLNSENTKGLAAEDREWLAKILKTYINIKFFPESMPTDDGQGWEILPGGVKVEKDEENSKLSVPAEVPTPPSSSGSLRVPVKDKVPATAPAARPAAPKAAAPVRRPAPASAPVPVPVPVAAPKPKPAAPAPVKAAARPVSPRSPQPVAAPVSARTAATDVESLAASAPAASEELMSLKNMLLQYPAGSLERTAIEEEIKKISQA